MEKEEPTKFQSVPVFIKTFLYLFIVGSVLLSFLSFNNGITSDSLSYDPDTVFLLGAQSFGYNSENNQYDPWRWYVHMPYYKDSLHMNAITFWRNELHYEEGIYDGGLYNPLSGYRSSVNNFINYMNDKSLVGIYERGTISKLCLAQRSTYQVEDNEYYGFLNNVSPTTGSGFSNDLYGASGRYCQTGTHSAGYIVSGLIENAEQSDNWKYAGAGAIDDSTWFIKPRMRIDSADAINHSNDTICKIEVYSFNESKVKTILITGFNFLPISGNYKGTYLEEFNNVDLSIPGDTNNLNKGAHTTNDETGFNFDDCKVDYRICGLEFAIYGWTM